MLTLYTYFRSSAAFRVRIALNLRGLAYEPRFVSLPAGEQRAPDYRALNPQGLVPTLLEGEGRLTQSMAIIEYLDETQPGEKLLPADALGRARVRALAQIVSCEIHPVNNLRILNYLKNTLGIDQPRVDAWYRHWCEEGLAAFELAIADGAAGRYCHGDAVSLADICLVPQIFNAKRFEVDLKPYPRTMAIFERLMKLPAFDTAQPGKQPDAPKT